MRRLVAYECFDSTVAVFCFFVANLFFSPTYLLIGSRTAWMLVPLLLPLLRGNYPYSTWVVPTGAENRDGSRCCGGSCKGGLCKGGSRTAPTFVASRRGGVWVTYVGAKQEPHLLRPWLFCHARKICQSDHSQDRGADIGASGEFLRIQLNKSYAHFSSCLSFEEPG